MRVRTLLCLFAAVAIAAGCSDSIVGGGGGTDDSGGPGPGEGDGSSGGDHKDGGSGADGGGAGACGKSGATQPCYSGPVKTRHKGICTDGVQTCKNGAWGACVGEVLPAPQEICGNLADDDCDGVIDNGCPCNEGAAQECYTGPAGTEGVGPCKHGYQFCSKGAWGACTGEVVPRAESCAGVPDGTPPDDTDCDGKTDPKVTNACGTCGPVKEICGNGLDDDCDGVIDNGCDCQADCLCDDAGPCECKPRTGQPCYDGPAGTAGKGECKSGLHDCTLQSGKWQWTACKGEVLPVKEVCGDGKDNDCDGAVDNGCSPTNECEAWETRPCYTGPVATRNIGACHDGVQGCVNGKWNTKCPGEVTPDPLEKCGDGLDNDCNGKVDDGCGCDGKGQQECWPGRADVVFNAASTCKKGVQSCVGGEFWGDCKGAILPTIEVCGDGKDNNCDGQVDEGCECLSGQKRSCYSGDPGTENAGECRAGTESCTGGKWSGTCAGEVLPADEPCGSAKDLNCDGLTGGVVNACGKCDQPCYDQTYDKPGDCKEPGRACNGTEPDPNDPNSITLGQAQLNAPFIYIAQDQANMVVKMDTLTGDRKWEMPSHGTNPSRTAVAFDYSVWVGNRGFNDPTDPNSSNVVHLDTDGNLICRADVTGIARSLAIDADGFVWSGTWNTKKLYRINGTQVDATQTPPRCVIEKVYDVGVSVYGLAVDGRGYIYSCSDPTLLRMDTKTGQFESNITRSACYGVAISPKDGRVWYGSYWSTGCVNGMNPDPPYDKLVSTVGCNGIISGVTVDHEGYVWASSYANGNVYKVDPSTGKEICHAVSPCTPGAASGCDARGVAEDSAGKIWVVNRNGGYANRFNRDCTLDKTFEVHAGVLTYTYSDMTGMQLRTVTTKEGHWVQDFDSGYAAPSWYLAQWVATTPPNTGVDVTFKAADTEGGLQSNPTAACGPFTVSPADLTTCPQLGGHRWLQADVRLWTKQDGVRPKFSDLVILWGRP